MHHGTAVERDGDDIGGAVNLAARAGHTTNDRLAVDPVYQMVLDPDHSAGRLV